MPCYQVQTMSVDLNNANPELLAKALTKEGYSTTVDSKTKQLSFQRGSVSGTYADNKLNMAATGGARIDTDAIKRQYSTQVIETKAKEYEKKGWKLERLGPNKFAMTKPEVAQVAGMRR